MSRVYTNAMDSQVQEIKDKLPINEVVGQYVQLRRAGRNFTARCPFHKERTPSFHVSPERNSYMCFGCGEKGDIFTFVQKLEGIDFPTALKQLADKAGVVLKQQQFTGRSPEEKNKEERLYEVCEAATLFFEQTLKNKQEVIDYLHTRGVLDETITTWRLGYAPASWEDASKELESKGFSKDDIVDAGLAARSERKPGEVYDRFRGRIMCPIFDANGKVIAFSGRIFEEMPPKTSNFIGSSADTSRSEVFSAKYVNSPETALFKKSKVLYGFDKAKANIRKLDCILLVEGQFDLLLSHQSGLPFAVALSGTALTPEHLQLLGRLSKRLVLALDSDQAGIRAGLKSTLLALQAGFDVKIPSFPAGEDPADIAKKNPELLKAAVRTSKTAIEYFLEALRIGVRDERAYKLVVQNQLLPLVAAMSSSIDQSHFIHIIADRIGTPDSAVQSELAKVKNRPPQTEYVEESVAPVPEVLALLPLEKSVGMLLAYFNDKSEVVTRVEELIGKPRLLELQTRFEHDAERLRFEFESLGDDAELISSALLTSIERAILEEEMKSLKVGLHSANIDEAASATKRLLDLKRREQELRK